jgi:hypothetical protein
MANGLIGTEPSGISTYDVVPLFTPDENGNLVIATSDLATVATYVLGTGGECVAIIGDISKDNTGASTGLSGAGLASKMTGSWVQL